MRPSSGRTQSIFSLFPKNEVSSKEDIPPTLPPSMAPPRLQLQSERQQQQQGQEQGQKQGREKRQRIGTAGYKEAWKQGLMGSLGHSQTQHYA